MGVVQNLSALALRPLLDGVSSAGGDRAAEDALTGILIDRFTEHHQRLSGILHQANERAWLALEMTLTGETFYERVKNSLRRNADELCHQHVRSFLDSISLAELANHGSELRQQCLDELRAARSEGLLSLVEFDPRTLAQQAGDLHVSDPQAQRDVEEQALERMANEFRQTNYPALALLLSLRPTEGPHLLVAAARFFLRRAIEADSELTLGWALSNMEANALDKGLAALGEAFKIAGPRLESLVREVRVVVSDSRSPELDIKSELPRQEAAVQELGQEVTRLLEKLHMGHRHLRPCDSLAISDEKERLHARGVVSRFRTFAEEQRRQLPALCNGIAMLEVAIGEFEEAQRDFQQVAGLVAEPQAQAEAHFNAYRAALELLNWNDALAELRQAIDLSPEHFAPFPAAKYELDRILGAGGFGVAFLCRNRHSGGRLVVKALRVDSLERDIGEVFREVRVLEELNHPAIIRLRDCDYVRGDKQRPFLIMDYFEGQTLAEYVQHHGALTPAVARPLFRSLAEALKTAHARDVWHRNITPSNILVRRDGHTWDIRLIDFGLAIKQSFIHATIGDPTVRARTGLGRSVSGMIDYAAPEQLGRVDNVAPGPYSDIYGFGRVGFFALLCNPEPDEDEKESLPEAWRRLLTGCTTRNLAKRLPTFDAVLERLQQMPAETATMPALPPAAEPKPPEAAPEATHGVPRDAMGYNDRGIAYASKGAYDRAIADFTKAIEIGPPMAQPFYNRGDLYRAKGDFDKAILDFNAALKLDPKYILAYINQGRTYRLKGEYDKAIADFSRALKVDPKYADAYNNRGNAYADKGDYDKAIADYSEALKLDPNLALAYMNRGLAYAKKGDYSAVIADCNEALRLNQKFTAAYFIRGAAHSSKGDFDKAISDFSRVLRLDPKYALAYNDRGLAFASKGEYDKAIADYTQALRYDPKLAIAYMNRAIAYRLKGENDRSITEFTKLLRLYPKNAMAYTNRGLAYFAKNDYDRAIADFTEALWIDPNHAEAYSRRVEAFRAKSERDKADEERRRQDAAAREEKERRQGRATAHFTRAQMHFDNGHYDRAIADFSEAIKFDPSDALFHFHRGQAYAANDEHDKAIADYSDAVRLDPKMTLAYYQRGICYRLRSNYARAVADFTETIRLDPKHALAYRNRGLAHAAMGDQSQAKADYEEAVRIDPALKKS